jgi:ribosomal protein S27E
MTLSRKNAAEKLSRGIDAAKSGNPKEYEEAEYFLEWVLRTDADIDQQMEAWYWLSRITTDPARKRECLENALAIRPSHPDARRELAILDGRLKPEDMRANPLFSGMAVVQGTQVAPQEIRRFRCPRCGASVTYNPGAGQLSCQFCGAKLDEQGQEAEPVNKASGKGSGVSEQDWVAAIYTEKGHRWALPQDRVLQCEGCGAAVTFTPARVSAKCAYCGAPYAVRTPTGNMSDLREPDGVIPFRFDAHAAAAYARAWFQDRASYVGVPGDLPTMAALQMPEPVYLPFWTFDIAGEITWRGWVRKDRELAGLEMQNADNAFRLGGAVLGLATGNFDIAAQALGGIGGRFDKSDMEYAEGAVGVIVTNVAVPATRSLSSDMLDRLHFEIGGAIPYREDIFASWPAEIYSISMADCSLVARRAAVKEGDHQITLETGETTDGTNLQLDRTGLTILSYKLLLLPLWTAAYTYKSQLYRLTVNGQTGQVEGDYPGKGGAIKRLLGR